MDAESELIAQLRAENAELRRQIAASALQPAATDIAAFNALFADLPLPVALYQVDGLLIALNRAHEEMFSTPAVELLGRYNIASDSDEHEQIFLTHFRHAQAGIASTTPPTQLHLKRLGRTLWIEATYFPIYGPAGDLLLVGELLIDVDARVQADQARDQALEALAHRERRLRVIFENSASGITLVTPEGETIAANPAMAQILGCPLEELIGRRIMSRTHPEDVPQERELFSALISGHRDKYFIEKRYVRGNGSLAYARLVSTPVRGPDGTIEGVVRMVEDVTAQKQVEAERQLFELRLRETQKLESLGLMAGGIAHDFNNLLVAILGNASLALDDLPATSPTYESLQQIELAARRAADLTRQLLAYAGKGRLSTSLVHVNQLIHEMSGLLRTSLARSVRLHYELSADLPLIEADPTQISQVIMNLVINGSEAISSSLGSVTVSSDLVHLDAESLAQLYLAPDLAPGPYVRIAVRDTGSGMSADVRRRIFEPFFSTKFTGRGLGLAAVLGIVRGHHGAINVYSEPGRGSLFHVLLPVAGSEAATLAPPVVPQLTAIQGSVLLVDDETEVRSVTRHMLERLGLHVYEAADATAALALAAQHHTELQLALLDITMPEMGGEELAAALRSAYPHLLIVLMSGYSVYEANHPSMPQTYGFLAKPFVLGDLSGAINAALALDTSSDAGLQPEA